MSDKQSPFIKRAEVSAVHPVSDGARVRAEAAGLFPKRILLAPKTPAWRRSDVDAWLSDPAAWAERHRSA